MDKRPKICQNYVLGTPELVCQCFYVHSLGIGRVIAKIWLSLVCWGVQICFLARINEQSQKDWTALLREYLDSRYCGASVGCRHRSVSFAGKLVVVRTWEEILFFNVIVFHRCLIYHREIIFFHFTIRGLTNDSNIISALIVAGWINLPNSVSVLSNSHQNFRNPNDQPQRSQFKAPFQASTPSD